MFACGLAPISQSINTKTRFSRFDCCTFVFFYSSSTPVFLPKGLHDELVFFWR